MLIYDLLDFFTEKQNRLKQPYAAKKMIIPKVRILLIIRSFGPALFTGTKVLRPARRSYRKIPETRKEKITFLIS